MNGAVPDAQLVNQTLTQETQGVDTGAVSPRSGKHGAAPQPSPPESMKILQFHYRNSWKLFSQSLEHPTAIPKMKQGNSGSLDSVGAKCKHVLTVLAKENRAR